MILELNGGKRRVLLGRLGAENIWQLIVLSAHCSVLQTSPPAVPSRLIFMDDITKMSSWLTVVLDQWEQREKSWRAGGEQFCFSPSVQAYGRIQRHAIQLTTACPPVKQMSWFSVAQGWTLPSIYLFEIRSGKHLWLLLVPRGPAIFFFLLAFLSLSLVLLLVSLQTIAVLCTYFACLLGKKREGVKMKGRL